MAWLRAMFVSPLIYASLIKKKSIWKKITDSIFEEIIKEKKPVLIDFYTEMVSSLQNAFLRSLKNTKRF
jgi:hypothetical protein